MKNSYFLKLRGWKKRFDYGDGLDSKKQGSKRLRRRLKNELRKQER